MATNSTRTVTPRVDVYESPEDVLIFADLPGVAADALSVRVEQRSLILEAPRSDGATYRRVFDVPAVFDTSKVDAELKQGVLRLKLARSEASKPRRIDVRAA